jgi:hypothetical protein
VVNRAMGRHIWGLLQANQRFNDRIEVQGGFKVPSYNERPIIRIDNEAASDLGAGTTASKGTVLLPDFRHIVMPILMWPNFQMIGKVEDKEKFFIRMYCTLAVEGINRYHSKITAIDNTV